MSWHEKERREQYELHVNEFDRMDGRDGEGRRLLVRVMKFVEVLVQERRVIHSVVPVSQVILLPQNRNVNLCCNLAS